MVGQSLKACDLRSQLSAEGPQFSDPPIERPKFLPEQRPHPRARRPPCATEGDQLPDFLERESERLSRPDEP